MKKYSIHRREFLKKIALTTLGGSSAFSLLGQMNLAHASIADATDYKALVCVFLFGGNDGFNMLIPSSDIDYNVYAQTRQTLAINQTSLLGLNPSQNQSVNFGLHPSMSGVQELYNSGHLAFLSNVGALIEPTTKTAYQNSSVLLPPRLFSHNDQQDFVMSLETNQFPQGWASRMADLLSENSNDLSMNITLSGNNTLQGGGLNTPYTLNPNGVQRLNAINFTSTGARAQIRAQTFLDILNQGSENPFVDEYAKLQSRSIDLGNTVTEALDNLPELTTTFNTSSNLAIRLRMIANMIAVRQSLGVKRQIFFVGIGGWDTHGDQLDRHTALLGNLSTSLKSFYDATVELNIANQVTTFTASDFGRTLTSNGDGTDHGWGGHQIVMGGAVNGGRLIGDLPDLNIGSDIDVGRGRVIPSTSIDQYAATLSQWFGLSASEIRDVFPNLANFNQTDLGIFAS